MKKSMNALAAAAFIAGGASPAWASDATIALAMPACRTIAAIVTARDATLRGRDAFLGAMAALVLSDQCTMLARGDRVSIQFAGDPEFTAIRGADGVLYWTSSGAYRLD